MKRITLSLFTILFIVACNNNTNDEGTESSSTIPQTKSLAYTITNVYPHDTSSFTEGLEWHDGALLESTGEYGVSRLLKVNLKDGKPLKQISLAKEFFGEGITLFNGKIYQLTYKEQKCFVYDVKTFKKLNEFSYDGEGWGLTNNGKQIIMSNGSSNLYFRDPETFKVLNIVGVSNNFGLVNNVNELEYVNGVIYANIWTTNKIIKIDPSNGKVLAEADFSNVLQKYVPEQSLQKIDVFNGIAYDSIGKRFFLTGKYWPKVFEVKFDN